MEVDFVSEVDRKFFANNLLSNEDLEATADLSDIISFDAGLTTEELINRLPDELQLPFDDDFSYLNTVKQHDIINEWSDSSDSGVSGLLGREPSGDGVKSEPLSPASNHSDSGDSLLSQISDPCHAVYLANEVQQDVPSFTSCDVIDLEQQPSPNFIYSIKPENYKPVLSPTHEDPVKLQSILNSKIKIQPKPESLPPHSKTVPSLSTVLSSSSSSPCPSGTSSQQKSLVLTAEEFARLTNQGVLRFDPPKPDPVVQPTIIPSPPQPVQTSCASHHPVTSPTVPLYAQHKLNIDDSDVKIMKRQQRMIKNRESASLSRKRKKEYLTQLESRLNQFNVENERLKEENNSLKRKLEQLVSENEGLKKKSTFMPVKTTALLAVIFMLSLNLAPWSNILTNERSGIKDQVPRARVHTGRQLMSVQEEPDYGWENTDYFRKLHDLIMEYGGAGDMRYNQTDLLWNMCPTYFNKTESIRLAEQLAGWMSQHQEQKKVEKKQGRRHKEKQLRPLSSLKRAMRGEIINSNKQFRNQDHDTNYQVQVFGGAETGRDFLKSIHRRNDTFYVLSFDTDYWLVPAVAHNKTMRPRMSLVMPALTLNESMSPPPGRVGMMQIDCEVMNTQLIHVQKSAIPKRDRENSTHHNFDRDQDSYYP